MACKKMANCAFLGCDRSLKLHSSQNVSSLLSAVECLSFTVQRDVCAGILTLDAVFLLDHNITYMFMSMM